MGLVGVAVIALFDCNVDDRPGSAGPGGAGSFAEEQRDGKQSQDRGHGYISPGHASRVAPEIGPTRDNFVLPSSARSARFPSPAARQEPHQPEVPGFPSLLRWGLATLPMNVGNGLIEWHIRRGQQRI